VPDAGWPAGAAVPQRSLGLFVQAALAGIRAPAGIPLQGPSGSGSTVTYSHASAPFWSTDTGARGGDHRRLPTPSVGEEPGVGKTPPVRPHRPRFDPAGGAVKVLCDRSLGSPVSELWVP